MGKLAPRAGRVRAAPPLVAGVVVALLAGVLLTVTHRQPRPVVAPPIAIRAALHDPTTAGVLAHAHWNRIKVDALDDQLDQVTFLAGGRLVDTVAVDRSLHVQPGRDASQSVPYGDWIAYQPAVLALLCALFVLMSGVTPWRRLRNLDVVACLSFVAPVVLMQREYVGASMLSALPGMAYLLVRCTAHGLGGGGRAPARPLLDVLTPGLDPVRRVRWLRVVLTVLAAVYVMVGVSSPAPIDVIYAVMEGATRIVHGVLPYGHLPPGIVHGDTYPILSYALYVPLALLEPVNSLWDSVDAGLAAAVLAALIGAWAVFRMLVRTVTPFARASHQVQPGSGHGVEARSVQAEEAGLRAALAWLAFPPLLATASTGTTDVALAAMVAGAVLLWRRPAACAAMLAVAGWFKLAPFALLPVRLAPLRGRRLLAPLAAVALVSVPLIALLVTLGGIRAPVEMVDAMSFQFSRGSLQSAWTTLGIEWLQPLVQACVLGLIAAAVIALRRDPGLADQPARMASLMAAILIGLQLSADYWAFLYAVWAAPLLVISLLSESGDFALFAGVSRSGHGRTMLAGVQPEIGCLNSSGVPVDHLA
ncbi:MAG TPA: glycosyltransferase 87 family protein [Solirubrobacteraceae bacterium]|nr:glycosyltransferase 87 family protein [Solirubrobacteraceae bacterium]